MRRFVRVVDCGDDRPARRRSGTVVHAKVVVADDVVSFGTVNLDAWALSRNSEIELALGQAQLASLIARSIAGPGSCTAGPCPTASNVGSGARTERAAARSFAL